MLVISSTEVPNINQSQDSLVNKATNQKSISGTKDKKIRSQFLG